MTGGAIRVVLADDHPVYRQGLAAVVTDAEDVDLVGVAADGGEAVALAVEHLPDVALLDVHMPGVSGIDATRRLAVEAPQVAVLVLTMLEDDESVLAAMAAGARGYLVKGATGDRILAAIRAVAAGEAVFGPTVADHILDLVGTDRRSGRRGQTFSALTEREEEVLTLIAAGRSNREIAQVLVVADKTVRNHVSSIFTKLQVADRAQAIVKAREAGLGRT
ncbi:response regulator transcription factor [Kribbella sp. NBC_00359]|uniref:response regulator transcription factor n=1 Tax=Kribbella sp. NBC_00359 TaxID=2975966 RepID=UPI002E212177